MCYLKKQLHTLFYYIRILYQTLVLLTKQQQKNRFYFEMFWAPSKETGKYVYVIDIYRRHYIYKYTYIYIHN